MRNTFASITGMPYGKTKEEHRAYMRWWRHLNREDYNKKRLEWANNHRTRRREQARRSYLQGTFGVTLKEYDTMLARQGYRCAICSKPFKEISDSSNRIRPNLHIDHDHKTGEVCGLLCYNCNLSLGLLSENPQTLINAIKYLESTRNMGPHILHAIRVKEYAAKVEGEK